MIVFYSTIYIYLIEYKLRFDHLRREASEHQPHQPDEQSEPWRSAFEKELTEYIKERYTYGACTVIGGSDADTITLAAFIESHKFEPKNFWYR
jgi:capping protein alpha